MFTYYKIVLILLIIKLSAFNVYGLISPVRRGENNKPYLTNCKEIRLIKQVINLYHHPLGIWEVSCTFEFQNLYPKKIVQEMAFNSGYDIGMSDGEMYCDEFYNFKVAIDDKILKNIKMKEQCPNYVERIGIEWSNDNRTGIGFLNTWNIEFEPEETKHIKVSFSFIVKNPAIAFQADNKEPWYVELMAWTKSEYHKKAENDFVLPLNMGSFWTLYVDSLKINTYYSDRWLLTEDRDKVVYKPEHVVEYTYCDPFGFFSPPDVELQDLTAEDLKGKTKTELILLRNSFFAKYGRKFDVDWLRLYFNKQSWYYENPHYDNWYLNDFDIQNIKFIHQFEKQRGTND